MMEFRTKRGGIPNLARRAKRPSGPRDRAHPLHDFANRGGILRSPKTKPCARKIPKRTHTTEAEKAAAWCNAPRYLWRCQCGAL